MSDVTREKVAKSILSDTFDLQPAIRRVEKKIGMYLFVYVSICICIYVSMYLIVYVSISLCIYLSMYL
jgi:hypothetical protein